MIGREILNYVIEEKIGEGGMATVYKARHKTLHNTYRAIKVLHPAMAADAGIKAKFINEAQTLAKLNHPALVKVYDYFEQGHELFLIMEFVAGIPLDEMLKNVTGPLPEPRVKKLFATILDGIGYAHSMGIVHRDIKPSNIIISPQDEPKIIDFGIVKVIEAEGTAGATKTGTRIGTAMYMSPEQILAKGVDHRTDIYALGITLFNMVTGRAPFDSATLSEFEIQQKMVSEPLPRARTFYPSVSEHLQTVIDKATAKKKEDRFQDCSLFKAALADQQYKTGTTSYILNFSADKASLKKGGQSILRWEVAGVDSCIITGLGTTKNLNSSTTISPAESTTYILKAGGEEKAVYVEVSKPGIGRKALAAIGISALLVISGFIYAMESGDGTTYKETTTTTEKSAAVRTPAVVNNNRSTDYASSGTKEDAESAPERQPLETAAPTQTTTTTSGSNEISEDDRKAVNAVIARHTATYDGSISEYQLSSLISDYDFPVDNYYQKPNVDYAYVAKANDIYYNNTIRQSRWNIDTDISSFSKKADGTFDVEIFGDYYFYYSYQTKKNDPNVEKHLYLHNHYKLSNKYEIMEEYEVERRKIP